MQKNPHESEFEDEEPDFKPLTAQEAQEWRSRNPGLSVWRVVAWQALLGVAVSLVAALFFGRAAIAWSVAYGACSVVLPAALFARGVARHGATAGTAMMRFFVWELAKIVLTIALLVMAPYWVKDLSWLALLVGMVVTM